MMYVFVIAYVYYVYVMLVWYIVYVTLKMSFVCRLYWFWTKYWFWTNSGAIQTEFRWIK